MKFKLSFKFEAHCPRVVIKSMERLSEISQTLKELRAQLDEYKAGNQIVFSAFQAPEYSAQGE
jgi:hypothetical protein